MYATAEFVSTGLLSGPFVSFPRPWGWVTGASERSQADATTRKPERAALLHPPCHQTTSSPQESREWRLGRIVVPFGASRLRPGHSVEACSYEDRQRESARSSAALWVPHLRRDSGTVPRWLSGEADAGKYGLIPMPVS